ncbi:glycosyltransferase family protein [Paenibacillus alginolyticus]|uniref:Glycosyltransferase family protein n=1 Tax=Paenibacillus alginolyticus TaxID=59839 RepID=A0ABT4G855_9BACL|nr:glycosyltransferase family protein [Paenibacillus alginolyticus]MCY9692370.1 glycosyltransferase family protein [Paenibacillus alginolyticus]MEC0143657.1 glycosyltransferase family protein [Paenibacillus alginolyticus]
MRTVAIIQARMGSTRLPGKVLLQLVDRTVLEHVINRVRGVQEIDDIVIATTDDAQDDPIQLEAEKLGVSVYRGSEQDVLARYYEAACVSKAEAIVRITSDCPVLDIDVTSQVIRSFCSAEADYTSNCLERSFPRGLDTEVFTFSSLQEAYHHAKEAYEREHVTPYLYLNPQRFRLSSFVNDQDLSNYRWTLDTIEDWKLIQMIYEKLYSPSRIFSWSEVLDLYKQHPELADINGHIEQKKLDGGS